MVQRFSKERSLRVVFFFNSERGLEVLKFLKSKINIKHVFLAKRNLNKKILNKITIKKTIIKSLKDKKIFEEIKKNKINLIVSAGFPYIFGKNFFKGKNKIDILNLHGGPIPRFKGGSPLICQKIEGRKKIGISVLKINQFIDSGKLMGVDYFDNSNKDNIKDIYKKSSKLFCNLLWNVIQKHYLKAKIKINTKKSFPAKYYFQRKPKDSLIDLKKINLKKFNNFFLALNPLYENPFLFYGEKKFSIYDYRNSNIIVNDKQNVGLVEKKNNTYFLNLNDKKIILNKTSLNLKNINGKILQTSILAQDVWLKNIFKKNCYITNDKKDIPTFKNYQNSFIFLKTLKPINTNELKEKKLLYLGKNQTFEKIVKEKNNYKVKRYISYKTQLKKNEINKVVDIAYKNFKFSRFHLDKRLSSQKSNLIKKKWVKNYFKGLRGDKIFVQFYKKKISGFCLYKFEKTQIARIDLICLDKKFSGMGLAKDMINYSFKKLSLANKKKVVVSTQEKNSSAIKLYYSLKFSPKSIAYLYHYIS